MCRTLTLLIVLASLAVAQGPPGSGDILPCWPSNATQVNCGFPIDTGCASNTLFCAGGWERWWNYDCTYYDVMDEYFTDCIATAFTCDTGCNPGNIAAHRPYRLPSWVLNPVQAVLGLFPRLQMAWRPSGRYGECRRVVIHG